MAFQIGVRFPNGRIRTFHFHKPTVYIGRGQGNDLRLRHKFVSNRHCRIQAMNHRFFISDLGSTNGTLVNGQPLEPHLPHPLRQGDVMHLGPLEIHVEPVQDATIIEDVAQGMPTASVSHASIPPASRSLVENAGGPSAMWQLQTGLFHNQPGTVPLDDLRVDVPRSAVPGILARPGFSMPFPAFQSSAPTESVVTWIGPPLGLIFQITGLAVTVGALVLFMATLLL